MASCRTGEIEYTNKYPCGILQDLMTNCPGKHETTNNKNTQGPCLGKCPAYNFVLHEMFYHTIEEWWENPTGIKPEAQRIRK